MLEGRGLGGSARAEGVIGRGEGTLLRVYVGPSHVCLYAFVQVCVSGYKCVCIISVTMYGDIQRMRVYDR